MNSKFFLIPCAFQKNYISSDTNGVCSHIDIKLKNENYLNIHNYSSLIHNQIIK